MSRATAGSPSAIPASNESCGDRSIRSAFDADTARRSGANAGPHEVLIALETAGIGSWDASIRDGSLRQPDDPIPPGARVDGPELSSPRARESAAFDSATTSTRTSGGNRQGGFYAEFAAADAAHVARIPKSLDLREAGAVATTGLTALQGLDALELRPGHTVLIFGAFPVPSVPWRCSSAAQRGAHVIATASGSAAARLVRTLGAHRVIDARRAESIDQLRRFASGGLDRVLAFAGGDGLERCLDFVRPADASCTRTASSRCPRSDERSACRPSTWSRVRGNSSG